MIYFLKDQFVGMIPITESDAKEHTLALHKFVEKKYKPAKLRMLSRHHLVGRLIVAHLVSAMNLMNHFDTEAYWDEEGKQHVISMSEGLQ